MFEILCYQFCSVEYAMAFFFGEGTPTLGTSGTVYPTLAGRG